MSLPEEALICSCEAVTKGTICFTVTEENCTTLDGIKKCTKAGTGCGGCVPMVKDLIAGTMKQQGLYVKNSVCEHFDFSRQELLDLIRINKVKDYDEVLNQFGKGDGCEVCKPAVASILASLWNDVILKQDTIQDSNDRFLANIQKGGSYSVVPRIPGGEITPDKLITHREQSLTPKNAILFMLKSAIVSSSNGKPPVKTILGRKRLIGSLCSKRLFKSSKEDCPMIKNG